MAVISIKNKTKSGSLLVGNAPFIPSDYESIATATGTGSSAVISFASIPSTYAHLQLRISGGNNGYACTMTFNSDTATNYANHRLTGTGSSVLVNAQTSRNGITFAGYSGLVYSASIVSATIMDILDYANTNKYKTTRDLTGYDTNSAGYIDYESGLWMSTSAINRIDLTMNIGNWASGSKVALYGIKG